MIVLPQDPDILALLPGFCEEWVQLLDTRSWPDVLASRDRDALRRFGHSVKGSFAQFGFPEGGAIGESLVKCSRDGDWEEAARNVAALRRLVAAIEAALQRRDEG